MAYRYLGSGTTNSDGKATYTYTGVGAGLVDVVASTDSPIGSGSFQSGTYATIDAIYYDDATSNTSSRYYVNGSDGTTVEYDNTNKSIKIICGTNTSRNYAQLTSSVSALDINTLKGKTVRFKANVFGLDGKQVRLDIYDNTTRLGSNQYSSVDGEMYVDATIPTNPTFLIFKIGPNASQTDLWIQNATYFFKDFTIYPI